ncbi:uncharacterized protein LOC111716224 [Eurytemora carolleeae]|uniref:uncharacterized protein LOC111716224 n=1 Tax=Eurytemora carolleeae TaxID=1294199 RepID=UPI000C7760E0|nr:uncharacterized protein LOC111716224 [Eurytemora carolleeae]|eukprot:XP_023347431.1 uncharacterized protein LOC111716224 [Eurytemora affinis]
MLNLVRLGREGGGGGGGGGDGWGEPEVCIPEISVFNCQMLVDDGKECKSQHNEKELIKTINAELQDTILQSLLEEGEQFSGLSLIGTSVYGIRRYRAGAWLASHLDHMATHVVSAILNIAQKGNFQRSLDKETIKHILYFMISDAFKNQMTLN